MNLKNLQKTITKIESMIDDIDNKTNCLNYDSPNYHQWGVYYNNAWNSLDVALTALNSIKESKKPKTKKLKDVQYDRYSGFA